MDSPNSRLESPSPITVHKFAHRASLISSQELLRTARAAVESSIHENGWLFVSPKWPTPDFATRGRCFRYARSPPRYPKNTVKDPRTSSRQNKEWGCAVDAADEDEVFSIGNLVHFESTHFGEVSSAEMGKKRKDTETPRSATSSKRPRFSEIALYRVVPQPHFRPPPEKPPVTPVHAVGLDAYLLKNHPEPILPHTAITIRGALDDPYGRAAWIVPVRGILPWEGCTSAAVLESESVTASQGFDKQMAAPRGPSSNSTVFSGLSQIWWTFDSVVTFWDFLRRIQEKGALGPISLSFLPASVPCAGPSTAASSFIGHALDSAAAKADQRHNMPNASGGAAGRTALLAVDHIKLYHDIRHSMHLRHVLYAWSYECHPPGEMGHPLSTTKIRMLKGAKLVLVDERSRAILVM